MRNEPPKNNRLKTSYVLICTTSLLLREAFHLVTQLPHTDNIAQFPLSYNIHSTFPVCFFSVPPLIPDKIILSFILWHVWPCTDYYIVWPDITINHAIASPFCLHHFPKPHIYPHMVDSFIPVVISPSIKY